ncbi:MAG: YgdI/YgdR family lipoprotein [Rhizobacter sp.]|jgi:hypothetical protein
MIRATVVLSVAAFALGACTTSQYLINTRDGGQVISTGKPELDPKAGIYTYTDANGRTSTIREGDVVHVMKR